MTTNQSPEAMPREPGMSTLLLRWRREYVLDPGGNPGLDIQQDQALEASLADLLASDDDLRRAVILQKIRMRLARVTPDFKDRPECVLPALVDEVRTLWAQIEVRLARALRP